MSLFGTRIAIKYALTTALMVLNPRKAETSFGVSDTNSFYTVKYKD